MQRVLGIFLVVLASVAFGFLGVFRHWAEPVSNPMLLAIRFLLAGVLLGVISLARRDPWPRGRVLLHLIGMGAVLYVIEAYTYFEAMARIPVGLVSLLLYTYPGMVALLAWWLLREKLTGASLVAVLFAVTGSIVTVWPDVRAAVTGGERTMSVPGVALGLACAVGYSLYLIAGSRLPKDLAALPQSAVVCTSAGVVFAIIAAALGAALPSTPMQWSGAVGLALVGSVIGITALLAGLARIGPVRAGVVSTVEPVATILVGWLILGQELFAVRLVGGGIILCAAIIGAVSRAPEKSPGGTDGAPEAGPSKMIS